MVDMVTQEAQGKGAWHWVEGGSHLEFLQSRRLPILVVVKEMCWSPTTISSSYGGGGGMRGRESERRGKGKGGRGGSI